MDTLVSTADGLRPIEEIQAGDYVWSENTETGERELKEVTDVIVTMTAQLVYVTTENGEEIHTTENHPCEWFLHSHFLLWKEKAGV